MSEQQELVSEASASAQRLPGWRRGIRWFLMVLGVLFLILMLIVAKEHWFPADLDVRDTINQVMSNEFGPYSDDLEGWTAVEDKQAYLMRVETQHEVTVGKARKLLLGVIGYPVDDPEGGTGKVLYRLLMVNLSRQAGEELHYIRGSYSMDVSVGFKSLQLEHLALTPELFGWQLHYETSDGGAVNETRSLYLVDLKKEEVVYSGDMPLGYDNSAICQGPKPYVAEEAEASASAEAASEPATEESGAEAEEEMPVPCFVIKASYELQTAKGKALPSWKVTATHANEVGFKPLIGKVGLDPHSLKLRIPAAVSDLFDEPFAE